MNMGTNRLLLGLVIALAAQCVLVLAFWYEGQRQQVRLEPQALFSWEEKQVDKIVVADSGGQQAVLQRKKGGDGRLPVPDLPADADKVKKALEDMLALRTAWPVTESDAGQERFEVSEEKFQRRVEFHQGDETLDVLYLGTSPGFRQTNVRKASDDAVYALELSSYDFATDTEGWMDKRLLQVNEVSVVEGADYKLRKEGGKWKLLEPQEEEPELKEDKVTPLVNALQNLRVLGIAKESSAAAEPEEGEGDALPTEQTLEVANAGGRWQYHFSRQGEQYQVKRDDMDDAFLISKTDYESTAGVNRQTFLTEEEEGGDEPPPADDDLETISVPIEIPPQ